MRYMRHMGKNKLIWSLKCLTHCFSSIDVEIVRKGKVDPKENSMDVIRTKQGHGHTIILVVLYP